MAGNVEVRDYASALDFLLGRVNYERTAHIPYASDFKLERMRRLLAYLGDPHLALKAVHIAGTKGKGSTAAMIAAVLEASGRKTGLYTSPHLERVEERMTIDGRLCDEEQFILLTSEVQQAVDRLEADASPADDFAASPTFFEVTTALAFLHFARERVDAAVLEVGLGGRLDSTNVCLPAVCAITSISFDHMRQLGHTLAEIAGEKAGIIKPGVPVISGVLADEPRAVIARRAVELGAPLFQRGREFEFVREACGVKDPRTAGYGVKDPRTAGCGVKDPRTASTDSATGERFTYREPAGTPRLELRDLTLGMLGEHQSANAACAVTTVLRLNEQGWNIDERAIRRGLAAARSPARIELIPGSPQVVIDVAHNPASIAALLEVLEERFAGRRKVLIFASSRDKDYAAMLNLLASRFETLILTRYTINPRSVEAEELAAIAESALAEAALAETSQNRPAPRVLAVQDPIQAWQTALRLAASDDLICITGSFFLAAELRPLVTPMRVEAITPPAAAAAG
jgi:dihydrofolate synthase/folylpolyglutamate synthase